MSTKILRAHLANPSSHRRRTARVLALALLATPLAPAQALSGEKTREIKLDNGIRVTLSWMPGTNRAALIAMYDVGFVDEPAGMTQVAHLAEHLRCMSATASFAAGVSYGELSQRGSANAETLPTFTYYDITCAPADLPLALKVEAERLSSLQVSQADIAQEAPRIYSETTAVESQPALGMGKHAVMALCQAWNHQQPEALVRGGLETLSVAQVENFLKNDYRPDQLHLGVCGDFDLNETEAAIRREFAAIARPPARETPTLRWEAIPKSQEVRWDSAVSCVAIAFPPPADDADREIASVLGALLTQQLSSDAELMKLSAAITGSNPLYPVGRLPLFMFASAKPGSDLASIESELRSRVTASRKTLASPQTKMGVAMMLNSQSLAAITPETIESQAKLLAPRFGGNVERATGVVIGNMLLQSMRAPNPKLVELVSKKSDSDWREFVERLLSDDQARIVRLIPKTK